MFVHTLRRPRSTILGIAAAVTFATAVAAAEPQFFKDKTITLVVGFSPAGLYDQTARVLARHIPRHIPGEPRIVVQNMPGAGGTSAVLHLYGSAPRDGTVLGMIKRAYATDPLLNPSGPQYEPARLLPIGSTSSEVSVATTWHTSGVKRFEDLFAKEIAVGATGATDGTVRYALLAKNLTPAKLRIVAGYPGGNEITLAMEKGEVDGRFGWSWGSVKSRAKDWLEQKKISIILQMGTSKAPDLPDVPSIMDYAKTELDRKALELLFAPLASAWPIVTTPDVPPDRLQILRRAFDATMKDPQFLAEAQKLDIEVEPLSGEEMAKIVSRLATFDRSVVERVTELTARK